MIPEEVELRIAKYFFHMYLPDEVMREVEEKLQAFNNKGLLMV
ncbi:hypothetical protein [Bacillus benzoevorans]|uniref:Uncharacterized protein n=1 Tax=Bacillus benzoevorans TaxID=1456 RepID=A0A7X0LYW6_9BACI|nr:hypothetical protein [Bacillus benzoevorans]MBB6447869.1 hypothetical protein [Bacillus benzoevorans]